ncbi:MAG: IS1595 family transposase [Dehalococcoidia bacterium]
MARRNPSTLLEFQRRFATDESCERLLYQWRWPKGFRCPRCEARQATRLTGRRQYQCRGCKYQVSVTAGTALHKSKLPLRVWFWAIFLVARHKKSVSALQLQHDLGLGSYKTAWLLLHKIRATFDESADYPLQGLVEVDETLIGAKGKGDPPGKDPGHKSIVVAAVEVKKRSLGSARLAQAPDYTARSLAGFVRRTVDKKATIATDGWRAYQVLEREGYERRVFPSTQPKRGAGYGLEMRGVHLLFSNLKTWLTGCFHGVSAKYLPAYLAEFSYRFNRRRKPEDIFGWVLRRLMKREPRTMDEIQMAGLSA